MTYGGKQTGAISEVEGIFIYSSVLEVPFHRPEASSYGARRYEVRSLNLALICQ